jgi:sugar/nucleoside kinase (ribokinase family)
VDTTLVQLHPSEPTGTTVAISTHSDRIFYSHAGANRRLRLDLDGLPSARLVHFACEPGPSHVALLAPLRQRGAFVTLDVGWRPEWLTDAGAIGILREIDLFFPNEIEAARLTGASDPERALEVCAERGLERVAIKCGARGASLLWQGKRYYAPAQGVEAIDTTGAGDCFNAGFTGALLSGWDPQDCLRAAVFCGSHSTRARGGIAGFPAREEFDLWRSTLSR